MMRDYAVDINSTRILPNGGIMTVNLYKMSQSFIEYAKTQKASSEWTYDSAKISEWLEPKGEAIVIQKPNNNINVEVTVDRSVYAPGDQVNYEIRVKDAKTGVLITDKDVLVSLSITDESVFSKIEERKQPPSLGAAIYLENEVSKISNELYYSNQYVDHWFNDPASSVGSSNRNLELLLGVQGWRSNVFDLPRIQDISRNIYNMPDDQKNAYQQMLSKVMVYEA